MSEPEVIFIENVPIREVEVRDADEPFVGFTANAAGGALVLATILEGTPAAAAGLKPGDTITGVNEHAVADFESFRAAILKYKPGQTVKIKVVRLGDTMVVDLKLARRGDHYQDR